MKKHRAPYAPRRLDPVAKAAWRRVVRGLIDAGQWHDLYRSALEILVVIYARWLDAERKAQEPGPGQEMVQVLARTSLGRVQAMIAEFGPTPAARVKVARWLAGDAFDDLQGALLFRRKMTPTGKVPGD